MKLLDQLNKALSAIVPDYGKWSTEPPAVMTTTSNTVAYDPSSTGNITYTPPGSSGTGNWIDLSGYNNIVDPNLYGTISSGSYSGFTYSYLYTPMEELGKILSELPDDVDWDIIRQYYITKLKQIIKIENVTWTDGYILTEEQHIALQDLTASIRAGDYIGIKLKII